MAGLRVDFGLLLEPLGFIKALEWIFSIFAFATCGGFQGETTLLVSCKGVVNKTVTAAFAYPFSCFGGPDKIILDVPLSYFCPKTEWTTLCSFFHHDLGDGVGLNTVVFSAPDPKRCGGTWTDVYLVGNFSSSAQFFVMLAVLVFLYCIAALVVYIGYKHVYQQNSRFPLTDFAITVITAFLWLVSTFAWAKALADIKMSTGASVIPRIESCKAPGTTCRFASVTSMGTLNVSVVFGLLNTVLWGGNIWFVYKDTSLHNQSNRISQSPGIYQTQREV